MEELRLSRFWKWAWIAFATAVLVFAIIAQSRRGTPTVSAAPFPGYPVPAFTLPQGSAGTRSTVGTGASKSKTSTISLGQFVGKPMMINFWASWCPPCQAETPDLVTAYRQFRNKVQFIGVNATAQDSPQSARAFIKRYAIPYPVGFDSTNAVVNQFEVTGFPTTLFVNAQGLIVARVDGALNPGVMKADLEKIAQ